MWDDQVALTSVKKMLLLLGYGTLKCSPTCHMETVAAVGLIFAIRNEHDLMMIGDSLLRVSW